MKCKHGLTEGTCWLCKGHKAEEQPIGTNDNLMNIIKFKIWYS